MKILIGCPTYEKYGYCVDLWIKAVEEIQKFSKDHQIDYLLVDNSKSTDFFESLKQKGVNIIKAPYFEDVRERVIYSRNLIRKKVLDESYDYFFSLEQDIIPEKDILEKLLRHKKEIVSAYYSKPVNLFLRDNDTGELKKVTIEMALVWLQQDENKLKRANPIEVLDKGLIVVGGFGIGCVLIEREILEKVKFKYEKDKKAFDDMIFCHDVKELGYKLFLDSDIKVKHLSRSWDRETV